MSAETEEPGEEQSFLSHLVELRQRIVRAAVAIVIVFIPMAFFMQQIFDFLSRPMMAALPVGAKLLATGVHTCCGRSGRSLRRGFIGMRNGWPGR